MAMYMSVRRRASNAFRIVAYSNFYDFIIIRLETFLTLTDDCNVLLSETLPYQFSTRTELWEDWTRHRRVYSMLLSCIKLTR